MGKLSLLLIFVVVCFCFVSSIIPPPPLRRMQKGAAPATRNQQANPRNPAKGYVTSWTSRRCSTVRLVKRVQNKSVPLLCHASSKRVLPRPQQADPATIAKTLMTMKANGWTPCFKSVPVTFYKTQKVPVCCPGTIPTPIGACMIRKPVTAAQQQAMRRVPSPGRVVISKAKAFNRPPAANARQTNNNNNGGQRRGAPLRPQFWKSARPNIRMLARSGRPVGRRLSTPALLRRLSSRTGPFNPRGTPSNIRQQIAAAAKKGPSSRPISRAPSFMLPLLSRFALKSQSPQTPQQTTALLKKMSTRAPMKPLLAKPVRKSFPALKPPPSMSPLFAAGPAGPFFNILMSRLNQVRRLPTKPVMARNSQPNSSRGSRAPTSPIGPFPQSLVDDFLFAPGPLMSRSGTMRPIMKDFLDDLLFSSVFRPNSFPGPISSVSSFPRMNAGGPLSKIPPPALLLSSNPLPKVPFPMMMTSGSPFLPAAALLSKLPASAMVPRLLLPLRQPPNLPNLLPTVRPPFIPPSILAKVASSAGILSQNPAVSLKTSMWPDLLSQVRSPMMPLDILSKNGPSMMINNPNVLLSTYNNPQGKAIPAHWSKNGLPQMQNQLQLKQRQQQLQQQTSPMKQGPGSELSEWQKDVARYLATMMYHKLQVEQQHQNLRTEVNRQNSLRRQLELLLTQQIIQTFQRQRKQQEEQQKLQQQQQQQQQQPQQQQPHGNGGILIDATFEVNSPPQAMEESVPIFKGESGSPVVEDSILADLTQQHQQRQTSGMQPMGDRLLPLVRGILDEMPPPPPPPPQPSPVFESSASIPNVEEDAAQILSEVKQKVRSLVNQCLSQADINVTMEQILQSGQPQNLRPICRASQTVGPCVLEQTHRQMGQEDNIGKTGRRLVQAVLLALGQTCAKLEEAEQQVESSDAGITSTPVFPNPPPEMIQDVVTEVTVLEPENAAGPDFGESSTMLPDNPPKEELPRVPDEGKATPLPVKMPVAEQQEHTHIEEVLEEVTPETEINLPLWMILVIVGACVGILVFSFVCICLALRKRRKSVNDVNRMPEKLPVSAELSFVLPPPAYPQPGDVTFKIPENNSENKQGTVSR